MAGRPAGLEAPWLPPFALPGDRGRDGIVVLDVPADADLIAYGVLLVGPGSVEADDLSFDVVDASVVPTDGGLRPHCQTVVETAPP